MVASSLIPLITIPIITRIIPPSEYGLFILAQVYASVVIGIAMMGLATGYERNYFQYKDNASESSSLLWTVTIFSILSLLIVEIPVYYWREYFAALLLKQNDYGILLVIVFIGLGFHNISQYYFTFLKNKGSALRFAKITVSQSLLNFILIIYFLVYMDLGVMGMAYALFYSNLTTFIVLIFLQLKNSKITLNKNMLMEALRISLPLTPRILFGALNTQFDKIMLGLLSNIGGVGIYGIGQSISNTVFRFMTALDHVFIPEIYHRFFSQENDSIDNIGKYLIPFFYVSIFAAMGVALFSEELFIILLPKSYHDGINIVIILTVFYASMFFGKVSGPQLIYAKKTYITSLLTLISVLINVLLNIPMIILWGTIGAAIATMMAGLISVAISYKVAQRYIPIKFEWNIMMKIIAIFIIAIVWTIITRVLWLEEYWIRLIGKIALITLFIWIGMR